MTSRKQIQQAVEISKLYYLKGITQAEIARQMNLSRPTVSRAIQFARDHQIVKVQINDPLSDVRSLSQQIKDMYHLKRVKIAEPVENNPQGILNALGKTTAELLPQLVRDDDVIGVSWGQTLDAVGKYLQPSERKNIQVVYLKGTVANSTHNNFVVNVTEAFNKNFHTRAQILPLPVIFDNAKIKTMVMQDHFIEKIVTTAEHTDVAVFTVGTTEANSTLFSLGYLSPAEIKKLQRTAVGDIVSQFVNEQGQIVDPKLSDRTMAVPLERLKSTRESILVAGGMNKLQAIKAALNGGYANVLVTDLQNAQALMRDED